MELKKKKKKKIDKWYFLGGRDLIYQMPLAGWCQAKGLLILNKPRTYKVTLSGESHRHYTTFWKRKQKYFIGQINTCLCVGKPIRLTGISSALLGHRCKFFKGRKNLESHVWCPRSIPASFEPHNYLYPWNY